MKRSLDLLRHLAAGTLCLALVLSAQGGSFTADFESGLPSGANIYGDAFVDTSGGGAENSVGVLKLTSALVNQQGSFIIDDLDPGQRIGSFLVTFKLLLGGSTGTPGDGCSFNFASDLPNASFSEAGAGTGITVIFDNYDNVGDNLEGPEIRVLAGGSQIANHKFIGVIRNGANYVDVLLRYNISGTLDLVFNNEVMFTNLWVSGTLGAGCRFGFSGRCGGGANENHFIDNLSITTVPVSHFYVKGGTLPSLPLAAAPDATIQVSLNDFGAAVLTNGIIMYFNGGQVSPTITKPGGVTTIAYDPPGGLLPGSSNYVTCIVPDSSGGPPATLSYNFTVSSASIWGVAPGSRSYLGTTDGSTTPLARSIGYSAISNQLYIVTRTGPTTGHAIQVLDPSTGADLYQLNTTGISGGSIVLLSVAVADDGSIYAANEAANSAGLPVKIYRWANSSPTTVPTNIYSGDPGSPTYPNFRWGDTMAVRGSGPNTQLIMDCQNTNASAIFAPTSATLATFTNVMLSHTYTGTVIGRGLQFGPGNTYWLKKKSNGGASQFPLNLIQFNPDWSTTLITSVSNYHQQIGSFALASSKNLAAGIFYATNSASYDRLVIYDISNVTNPLQVASYNFPVLHQANANFIGQVVFGLDKIFAIDGNNGILCVPALAPAPPKLTVTPAGSNVVLSWPNTVPGFVLQGTPDIGNPAWVNLSLPISTNLTGYAATNSAASTNAFYRLLK